MRRLHCETADWHVFARGARRLQLFRDDQDYSQFLRYLAYSLRISKCVLWAFALMTNHYHLVLRGTSSQLTSCMRRLNTMYSAYHNKRYGLDGHTFDGPYQAYRQATGLLKLRCIAYVFYNPVKGGLCLHPEEYPWSGCRSFLGLPGSPIRIDPAPLIESIDRDPRKAWARFHEAMEREAKRPSRPASGRPTMIELHQQQFEWLLERAQEVSGHLNGEDLTLVAMHWARQVGVTPKAMAKVLGQGTTASIRERLYRFNLRLRKQPDLEAKLALF